MNGTTRELDRDDAIRLIKYTPETGEFHWRKFRHGIRRDMKCGCFDHRGYLKIRIYGIEHLGHRLAWFMTHGRWPTIIDHINRNKSDNRIANLREVTGSNNQWNKSIPVNNTTSVKGVSFDRTRGQWMAMVNVNGKRIHLGRFKDQHSAAHAVREKRAEIHGEYACD